MFKAGQHVAAKYDGRNGDLIVGRVDSVRHNGVIVLTNLLTSKTSTKKATVLKRRNKRISAKQAKTLVALWKKCGNRWTVRKAAVALPPWGSKKQQELVFPKKSELPSAADVCTQLLRHIEHVNARLSLLQVELDMMRKTCSVVVMKSTRKK